MSPYALERRTATEIRTAVGRKLVGYAATFGTPAPIAGFTETIRAGAFRASLATSRDTLALLDHDSTRLLARTSNGTLRLSEDARGLAFEIELPNTTLGNDVLAMAEARLLGGMSFGFRVPAGGDAWPSPNKRELHAVDLAEISVVQAFPAYSSTTVDARSRFRAASIDPARVRRALLIAL